MVVLWSCCVVVQTTTRLDHCLVAERFLWRRSNSSTLQFGRVKDRKKRKRHFKSDRFGKERVVMGDEQQAGQRCVQ